MSLKDDIRANNQKFRDEMKATNAKFKADMQATKEKRQTTAKKVSHTPRFRAVATWKIVLFCLFLFPVGLYLIWRKDAWSRKIKRWATVLVTAWVILCSTLLIIFAPPSVDVTSALSATRSADYTLTGTISPTGSIVTVNGQKTTVTNTTFSTKVQLKEGDNTLHIVIVSGSKRFEKDVHIHRYTQAEVAAQEKIAAQKKAEADAKKKAEADAAAAKQAQQAADKQKAAADAAAAAAKQQAANDAAAKQKAAAAALAAQQAAAAAAAKLPKVVLDISGSGIKQTQAFVTKSSWIIDYTFNCSNFGYRGNFQIYLNNTDGSTNYGSGPNDLAMSGGDTDYYYNDAGSHYLTVNSECAWHVVVKS